ncbi:hypothetical protein AB0945_17145 [Streptomyces sp. NPDC005474]|uniref:hypothetical protein n=1 Tax=Streptomyces sp. NPDC005474 TaxID=3154878 RepID=UPI00345258BD
MTTPTEPTTALPPTLAGEEPPPLSFNVPEGFFALPLAATPEERAERAQSFVRALYSGGDDTIWEPAAPYYAAIAGLMAGTGVSYAAMGLFSTAEDEEDGDESSHVARHSLSDGAVQCAFTVAAIPTDQAAADTDIVAQGILATLSKDPYNDARWLDLPCGPGVFCVTLRELKLRPDVTASGEVTDLLTGQIQVHVPFSTGPFTAIFTLYTASTEYWAEFCDLMAAILQTVSFTEPVADMNALDAAADRTAVQPSDLS